MQRLEYVLPSESARRICVGSDRCGIIARNRYNGSDVSQPDQQHTVQGEIMLKELIETMVTALVDNREQVKVSEIEGGMATAIVLRVAEGRSWKSDRKAGA